MKRIAYRYQRTIARPADIEGVGFLTGAIVHLRFLPAAESTGIVFRRTDLAPTVLVPAQVNQVVGTQRRTILGHSAAQIGLVEHVLAALAGLRIDNCCVELDAAEPPGLDGSSLGFVQVLQQAGIVLQPARREIFTATEPIVVAQGGATLGLHPADGDDLKMSYTLQYDAGSPIGRQARTQLITPDLFASNIASARTYIFEAEAEELRCQGLGARTKVSDLLVFGLHGPIENSLRFADEPARHKILDMVGDLALFGRDVRGHLVAYRSGHALNVKLVQELERRRQGAAGSIAA